MSCSVELSIIFLITSGPELFCEVSTPKFSPGTLTYINGLMPCDFTSFLSLQGVSKKRGPFLKMI